MKALLACGILFLLLFTVAVTADNSPTTSSTTTVSMTTSTNAIAPCDPGTPGCQPGFDNTI